MRRPWRFALCACALGCGAALSKVALTPNPERAEDRVSVLDPPPEVPVEHVPPQPGAGCKWLDGYWKTRGRSWEWQPGAWVHPPDGCKFAAPALAWTAEKELSFWNALWVPAGHGSCEAPRACITAP
jgi:hypothetical protein